MFGQAGFFLGPIIAGPLLGAFGIYGLLIPAGLCLPIALNAGWQLRHTKPIQSSKKNNSIRLQRSIGFIVTLAMVAVLQAWAQQNMMSFLPKYLKDLGQTPAIYGFIAGLFMGGSALGNLLGGQLADRFGKRTVATIMLLAASVPLFIISILGWSPWLYFVIPLAGLLTGSVHSIVVVIAQSIIKGGRALATGLILGTMFSSGAFGTLISGFMADNLGFPVVFQMTAGLVLVAAIVTTQLKETEVQPSFHELH
jgi:FSR family fosmidomycin resistance protein-like MFS transporter